jgi:hypothetical protein
MSDDSIQPVLKLIATSKRIPLETVTIDSTFEQLNIGSRNVCQMCEGVEKLVAAKAARALEP